MREKKCSAHILVFVHASVAKLVAAVSESVWKCVSLFFLIVWVMSTWVKFFNAVQLLYIEVLLSMQYLFAFYSQTSYFSIMFVLCRPITEELGLSFFTTATLLHICMAALFCTNVLTDSPESLSVRTIQRFFSYYSSSF